MRIVKKLQENSLESRGVGRNEYEKRLDMYLFAAASRLNRGYLEKEYLLQIIAGQKGENNLIMTKACHIFDTNKVHYIDKSKPKAVMLRALLKRSCISSHILSVMQQG